MTINNLKHCCRNTIVNIAELIWVTLVLASICLIHATQLKPQIPGAKGNFHIHILLSV